MIDNFDAENSVDENGNPTGGYVRGTGLEINWQNGPLGTGENRQEPNGAFIETILAACMQRLEFYQTANNNKFPCIHNTMAIAHLNSALQWLNDRTKQRSLRGVEGAHTP